MFGVVTSLWQFRPSGEKKSPPKEGLPRYVLDAIAQVSDQTAATELRAKLEAIPAMPGVEQALKLLSQFSAARPDVPRSLQTELGSIKGRIGDIADRPAENGRQIAELVERKKKQALKRKKK
jgi:hypothetical protein